MIDYVLVRNKGAIPKSEVEVGDMIYCKKNGREVCWDKVTDISSISGDYNFIKPYKLETNSHRTVQIDEYNQVESLKGFVYASDLSNNERLNKMPKRFNINVADIEIDSLYYFIGVLIADGYCTNRDKGNYGDLMQFCISKEWKRIEIMKLIKEFDLDYYTKDNEFNDGLFIFIKNKKLHDYFYELYNEDGEKHFPTEIWNDYQAIWSVIQGLMFDARKHNNFRYTYSSSHHRLVCEFCYALSMFGIPFKLYKDKRKTRTGKHNFLIDYGKGYLPRNPYNIIKNNSYSKDRTYTTYSIKTENNLGYVCGTGDLVVKSPEKDKLYDKDELNKWFEELESN